MGDCCVRCEPGESYGEGVVEVWDGRNVNSEGPAVTDGCEAPVVNGW